MKPAVLPIKVLTQIDYEAVFAKLQKNSTIFACTYEEARRINTWIRNVTQQGMSQKAVHDDQGNVIGYRLTLVPLKRRANIVKETA